MANNSNNRVNRTTKSRIANAAPQLRVIRFNFNSLLMLGGVLLLALFMVNALNNPSLGTEVSVDTFLANIKENNYASVDIRNDGNAVGSAKYIETVSLEGNRLEQAGKLELRNGNELEQKALSDVVGLFKPSSDPADALRALFGAGPRSGLRELYVLEDRLLVDWADVQRKDWTVPATEQQLRDILSVNNLDLQTLPVRVSFLRTAGKLTSAAEMRAGIENGRYGQVWQFENKAYARVLPAKISQTYVNYGGITPDFTRFAQEAGVDFGGQTIEYNPLPIYQLDLAVLINLLLVAGLIFTGVMLLRSINGGNSGLTQFGRSKARMFFGQKMQVNFGNVAGVDEAKEELREVVDFLKNPSKYTKLGAKIPRGVLMVGEPGTGKTLLARAVAGEAGVPFFHTSGSEFEEMLVGAGASRVRDLFEKAKKASPSLIFIDEIDAVGRKRGTTIQSSSTEQTLNQILVEMDGFEGRDNVIVIAATNRPDVLDPALLRPGRFDRKVVLDQPDIEGRKAILSIHAENKPLAAEVDLIKVAKRTVGFSGADLANMLNEAAIIVAKDDRKEITMNDIEEAATKVQTGPIRKRKRTPEELRMTAYHEAAHALVMKFTPESDPVHRITILSRGMALGYTMPLPESDQLQMTKTKMESKIRSLVAGFIAEDLVFGDVTTGASNDIEKATNLASQMVKRFGMSKKLGLVKYGSEEEPHVGWSGNSRNYSEATAEVIDDEVRRIVREAYDAAEALLKEHRATLDKIAEILLDKEVIEAEEFAALF